MADLAASIAKARKAGYSDAEIAAYIAKDPAMGPKVQAARQHGYSDAEVVKHLGKVNVASDVVKSYAGGLSKGVAGVADMVTAMTPFGAVNRLMSGQNPMVPNLMNPFGSAFSRRANETAHKPQSVAGEYANTLGMMTPNAVAPGSLGARAVNVFAPAVISETAGQAARGMGANKTGEEIARGVGAVAGGAVASLRPQNLFASKPPATPAQTMGTRARLDPVAMRARATEMRAAGVRPTVTDVAGEKGRRLIRAVGVKSEEGGEALTQRAQEATASTKPAAMVATRRLHPEARTASQYADDMETTRGEQATQSYGAFDAEPVEIPDTVKDMLSDASGRSIIARARADAIENQDWGRQAELDLLLRETQNGQLPRISAGTIDRLVIAARERGTAFARRGNNNRARGAFQRREQLDSTLDRVEGLRPARQAYSEQSRAIEVARGENRPDAFSTDPQDYGAWLQGLPAEARNANQIAIRQDIMDTLGGQRSNTFGTLDELATSPYARDNLRQAFGPQEADRYVAEIQARLAQTRNATQVQPNAGSRTAVLENDVGEGARRGMEIAGRGLRGDVGGVIGGGVRWAAEAFIRRGLSKEQAEAIARMVIDPNQTDAAIAQIAQRLAPQERQQLISLRNAALVGAAGVATGASRAQPDQR